MPPGAQMPPPLRVAAPLPPPPVVAVSLPESGLIPSLVFLLLEFAPRSPLLHVSSQLVVPQASSHAPSAALPRPSTRQVPFPGPRGSSPLAVPQLPILCVQPVNLPPTGGCPVESAIPPCCRRSSPVLPDWPPKVAFLRSAPIY